MCVKMSELELRESGAKVGMNGQPVYEEYRRVDDDVSVITNSKVLDYRLLEPYRSSVSGN